MDNYIDQLEDWMTQMKRDHPYLPESFFLLRFVSGLKDNIKHDTQCHKPATLRAAYWFARKQELSYLCNTKKPTATTNTRNAPAVNLNGNFNPRENRQRNGNDRPRERSKCWYCPENWSYGHKCNDVKNLLHAIQLQGNSDNEEEVLAEPEQNQEELLVVAQLSRRNRRTN